MVVGEEGLSIRLFDFCGLPGSDSYPKLPMGNISLLDNILPIGGMLAFNTDKGQAGLGSKSHMNEVREIIKKTVNFNFGFPKKVSQNGMSWK